MEKPTVEQVCWVFEKLREHLEEGGSFRTLIYTRLEFEQKDYTELYLAGGMDISNALFDARELYKEEEE